MESITRNVRDIGSRERQALEYVLGQQLTENQKIIIQIVTLPIESVESQPGQERTSAAPLPEWCNVFAGLTDEQVAEVEGIVLQRSDISRLSE